MKNSDAIKILELNNNEDYNIEIIKKKYKSLALLYHPDKNLDKGSTEKFQQIKEAYDFLMEKEDFSDDELLDYENNEEDEKIIDKNSYRYYLYSFLKSILLKDSNNYNISTIIQNITNKCEDNAIEIIKKLDKQNIIKTYEILKKYAEVLHIGNLFLEKIMNIILEKSRDDECIILNPILEDLFENNLYRLKFRDSLYIIPLWHHELIYDHSGNDILIKCSPILPENIEIDKDNNIIVYESLKLNEIWNKDILFITIGERAFEIHREQLLLKKKQIVHLNSMGISKINTIDIYDVSNKSDIIIYLEINL